MPGHMDKGTKNYRNMMKNMEKNMMRPDDIEPTTRDMLSSETIKPFEDDILDPPMPMSKFDEMLRNRVMQNKGSMSDKELDMLQGQMGRENIPAEMDMGLNSMMMKMSKEGSGRLTSQEIKLLEDALGTTVTDEIKEAVSQLLRMGVSMEDTLEALNMSMGLDMNNMAPQSMPEGSLGSLPTSDTSIPRPTPERLDADRTQSMDMQKTGMGT